MSPRRRARAAARISQSVVEVLEERRLLSFSVTFVAVIDGRYGNVVPHGSTSTFNVSDHWPWQNNVPEHNAAIIGREVARSIESGSVRAPGLKGEFNSSSVTNNFADEYLVGFGDGSTFQVTGSVAEEPSVFAAYAASIYLLNFEYFACGCGTQSSKPVRYADGAADFSTSVFRKSAPTTIPSDLSWSNSGPGPSSSFSFGNGLHFAGLPYIESIGLPWAVAQYNIIDETIGISLGGNDAAYAMKPADRSTFVTSFEAPGDSVGFHKFPDSTNGDVYKLSLGDGSRYEFFGFNVVGGKAGQLKSMTAPGGVALVTEWNGGTLTGVKWSYDETPPNGGSPVTVAEQVTINEYYASTNRVKSMTLMRDSAGTGTPQAIETAFFEYYGSSETHGREGDLKHVTLRAGTSETGTILDKQYFRWYIDSAGGDGYAGGLKMWLSGDSYRRAVKELGSESNVVSAADFDGSGAPVLAAYADQWFAFDPQTHKVRYERALDSGAGCACGQTGIGAFKFDYEQRSATKLPGRNQWLYKTIEHLPDATNTNPTRTLGAAELTSSGNVATVAWTAHGFSVGEEIRVSGANQDEYNGTFKIAMVPNANSFTYSFSGGTSPATGTITVKNLSEAWEDNDKNIVYTNKWGQPILKIFKDTSEGDEFITWFRYNAAGQVVMFAHPSAVSGYSESLGDLVGYSPSTGAATYLHDSSGLIEVTSYYVETASPHAAEYYMQDTYPSGEKKLIGYPVKSWLQRGDDESTAVLQNAQTYTDGPIDDDGVYFVASFTDYSGGDGDDAAVTVFDYANAEWYSGTNQVKFLKTMLPKISEAQNGLDTVLGSASDNYYIEQVFDTVGDVIWERDASGAINYYEYESVTGTRTRAIIDVDTDLISSIDELFPSAWANTRPNGLHLETVTEVDLLGRPVKITDPNSNVTYVSYDDSTHDGDPRDVRIYRGWNASTKLPASPVEVLLEDPANGIRDRLTFTWSGSGGLDVDGGVPTGDDALSSSDATLRSLVREKYNVSNQVLETLEYFSLSGLTYDPTSGSFGSIGTSSNDSSTGNYHLWDYKYDERGRQWRVASPSGTITSYVLDGLGRPLAKKVGTDDAVSTTNMRTVTEYEYDGGGIGDSNLTKRLDYPDPTTSSSARVTQNWYDWRNRLVATKGGVQSSEGTDTQRMLHYFTYDNASRVTSVTTYDADNVTLSISNGVPTAPSNSLRRARQEFLYDDQGREYRRKQYSVSISSGDLGGTLETNTWYDLRGNVMKTVEPGGLVTKHVYDGAGRPIKEYKSDGGGDAAPGASGTWGHADDVAGDIVLEQRERTYDDNGNLVQETTRQRFHSETTETGELGTASSTGSTAAARVSHMVYYYDSVDRLIKQVDVGTYGASSYSRPSEPTLSGNARSDTTLVTDYSYDAAGRLEIVTDPRAIEDRYLYDALGRTSKVIESYVNGIAETSDSSEADDRITEYTYNGRNDVLTMKAVLPSSTHQTTQYVYGESTQSVSLTSSGTSATATLTDHGYKQGELITISGAGVSAYNGTWYITSVTSNTFAFTTSTSPGSSSSGSARRAHGVFSNDLLTAVKYPDLSTGAASDSQREIVISNALGERIQTRDRNGNVHDFLYDVMGRLTNDYASTVGSGVKASIRELAYSFDSAGRLFKATSHGSRVNGVPGSGIVSNQVQREYNGLGQLVKEYQEHNGAVNTSTSEFVEYTYSEMPGGANHSRLVNIKYPKLGTGASTRTVHYEYSSGVDSALSRVSYLSDTNGSGTHLEEYTYLGLATVVKRSRPEPGTALTYISPDTVVGDAGDQYIGLDRFGRIADQRWYTTSSGTDFDRFKYGYDRNGNVVYKQNTVSSANSELYSADSVDGNSAYDALDRLVNFQRGTLSDFNTGSGLPFDMVASESRYQSWTLDALGNWDELDNNGTTVDRDHNKQNQITTSPVTHDANGNMTNTTHSTYVYAYDAWNRMVEFGPGSTPSKWDYPFDALHRRTQEDHLRLQDENFDRIRYRDLYYSDRWQVIAVHDHWEDFLAGEREITNETFVWTPGYVDELVTRDMTFSWDFFNPDTQEWEVYQSSADRGYAQQDANFNLTSVTTAAGAVVERFQYDPYGKVTLLNANWTTNTGYTSWVNLHQGGRYNAITRLHHFRFRDYSADLGRWMQPDPAGYVDGGNRYLVERANPVIFVDPLGLFRQSMADIRRQEAEHDPYKDQKHRALEDAVDVERNAAMIGGGKKIAGDLGKEAALSAGGGAIMAGLRGALRACRFLLRMGRGGAAAAGAAGAGATGAAAAGPTTAAEVRAILDALPAGNNTGIKVVADNAAVRDVFNRLTCRAKPGPQARNRPDIEVRVLDDGTRIQFRPNSGSGGDAVDVWFPAGGGRPIRVHIPKGG